MDSCTGTSRDLPNFVRRILRIPSSRFTSSRSRVNASLMRIPATDRSPKIVEYVHPFNPSGEGSRPAAWISFLISASL